MIDLYTNDLVEKLKAVPAFGGRVGATLGGTEADPTLSNIEVPAAWVVFSGLQNRDQRDRRYQMMDMSFRVVVMLDYGNGESDFVDTQLKLIDDASQAVRGEIVADTGSMVWNFDGASIVSINPDRIVYELSFSAPAAYSKQLSS